jgi:ankyrin repeat protein
MRTRRRRCSTAVPAQTVRSEVWRTAVLNGSASFAHMLLRAGALVDAANDNCKTALQIAVEGGSVEMVRHLILANANVQQHSDVVSQALCLCGIARNRIATLLLAAGAPVDATVIPMHVHLESDAGGSWCRHCHR